ncbi:carbohydrate ABC transporter permease [Dactylosporangium sp. CA-092794]|uniref:carbohydrate ABC transporter permease n=1 Tax=Dactylosporangium sp. CA-092794 TaxID=3239929 RepID=UPI003D905223
MTSVLTPRVRSTAARPARGVAPWAGWLLITPLFAGLGLFQFYPIAVAGLQSLQSFNPFTGASNGYVGLHNYSALFADPQFVAALRNTILYIVLTLVVEIPLALFLAQLIHARLPARGLLRFMVIAGLAASETVAILVWNQLYDPTHGLFNALLRAVGLGAQPFLTSPSQALAGIVVMSAWKNVGLAVLIFLAGLQNVPQELDEAANLDGAGPVRRFRHITLPMLRRYLLVALFVSTVSGTRIFTPIILMTQGGPKNSTTNLTYYAYQQAFQYSSYGVAAATTVCMLVLIAAVTLIQGIVLREPS